MQLTLSLDIPSLRDPIKYSDKILLTGSCFSENMAERLSTNKFKVLSNPNGILFNPLSVSDSINGYLDNRHYHETELFYLNELWNSWEHHTKFSNTDAKLALESINTAQKETSLFIKEADWVIITLGSAFQYFLKDSNKPVANNHRAPAQWFEKRLLTTDYIIDALSNTLQRLFTVNPKANVMFTISPVRHIRDGVIENNRSKARLIEAVHTLCEQFEKTCYFPSYELMIDILRDYRFYDIDFVHPNYLGTSYIWEQFVKSCISKESQLVMKEVQDIATARSHKPRFPGTIAHKDFKKTYKAKVAAMQAKYPFLDLSAEMAFFNE